MKHTCLVVCLGVALTAGVARGQQEDYSKVTIKTTKLSEGMYMLEGAGGNIAVSVGDDGVVLVDDQFAPLTPKIQDAVAKITPKPIRFVINTHWHGDHVGGNENLATAGAVIVAHDNVRKRMSTEQFMQLMNRRVPPAPARALPVVTFASDITLHLNGEDIRVIHVDPAHTDGDSLVVFTKAKILHTGDCFRTVGYPFVDLSSGGSYDGFIAVAEKVTAMIDDSYKVIPGHGVVSTRSDVKSWHDMLVEIRGLVKKQVDAGKTLEAIQQAKLTARWDDRWGKATIKPSELVEFVFAAVKSKH